MTTGGLIRVRLGLIELGTSCRASHYPNTDSPILVGHLTDSLSLSPYPFVCFLRGRGGYGSRFGDRGWPDERRLGQFDFGEPPAIDVRALGGGPSQEEQHSLP